MFYNNNIVSAIYNYNIRKCLLLTKVKIELEDNKRNKLMTMTKNTNYNAELIKEWYCACVIIANCYQLLDFSGLSKLALSQLCTTQLKVKLEFTKTEVP